MTINKADNIELDHGGGGQKSSELISLIRNVISDKGKWKNQMDDGATLKIGNQHLVFTTDAYIVDPIFFPGGDIGKIAVCGTINDLAMMGAVPQGLSLSMVIEEGFPMKDLLKISESIQKMSREAGVPIVTGDTKVLPKGKLDKIEITTAGVGLTKKIISNSGAKIGDVVISSGDLGEHTVALLSSRFNYKTKVVSDSKTLNKEMQAIAKYVHAAKDPTRGGLSANIIEIAEKSKAKIVLEEELLPYKKETFAIAGLLGIDVLSFASEGRFICAVSEKDAKKVLQILKKFNPEAKIIGHVEKGKGVFLKTVLGSLRPIEMPRGKLVPRIC
ncbi:MAG: Hydrogenase expression/formation protein HypE [Candidatus Moranbacteria bacterium GW2011_GWE1_36_7]|nr:MAG: Hydrogenase expression/formation protein HypE [Candidatus Moranbacteria bacterium GW2011_GWD2_36_12]KKQ04812.1 MAG: Hydrogenase expression/formation protein HypE [Candidatus Moranbacteria bacterium GW2011_GWE2_36_40]KKQ13357.1 MAG: Hydrogenase expression/formation protein HypE [Candidatus Moranbacteria bacterium GW2011_GWE1_36_7]